MDCPICLTKINNIDICVTTCNHTFHTSCLMRYKNNACPLCKSCIYSPKSSSSSNSISEVYADYEEYMKQIDKECDEKEKEEEIKYFERREEHKKKLKEKDIQKYELFYNNKKN